MSDSVSQFNMLTMQLINECLEYARKGVYDEETNRNINTVRVNTQVLIAALAAAQIPRPAEMTPQPQGGKK